MPNGVLQVANDPSGTRVIDADTGIQSIRGSQRVGEGFFESARAAYANLVYHPISLLLLTLGVFILVAELHNTNGPFEMVMEALRTYIADPLHPAWLRNLAAAIIIPLSYMIKYKSMIATVSLIFFTYVSKPSMRNLILASLFILYVIFVKAATVLDVLILSQLFYLFCNLRTPTHKIVIVVLFVALFATTIIDTDKLAKSNSLLDHLNSVELRQMYKDDITKYNDRVSQREGAFKGESVPMDADTRFVYTTHTPEAPTTPVGGNPRAATTVPLPTASGPRAGAGPGRPGTGRTPTTSAPAPTKKT